jgi:hypothetical protein
MSDGKFGPTRSELFFRLGFSVIGLIMLLGGILYRGMPKGPAMFETIGIAGLFFGGTLVWTLWKLAKKNYSDAGQ